MSDVTYDIAVDADGTLFTHEYPKIGKDIGAQNVLRKLVANGHRLILFTMRHGKELDDVVQWFEDNKIPLYGKQYNPTQSDWTKSNKCYAQFYIDDAAVGCPLIYPHEGRPYVDWAQIELFFTQKGLLKQVSL